MTVTPAPPRSLVDVLPDAVMHIGADGRVVAANRAAERITGYPRQVLEGARCAELLDARYEDGRPAWAGGFGPAARLRSVGRLAEQRVKITRADGTAVATAVTGTYLRGGDGVLQGVVIVVRPAARRREDGSGIGIVSTVSHELRSPLTSVKGFTSLLLHRWDRLDDAQKRMMLEQVLHDADRVTRLITELLDISRLESGKLQLQRHAVDLAALAGSVVAKVAMEYPEMDATVTFPDGYPAAWADADKIEQVLVNLVENACKYASPQGIRVEGRSSADDVTVSVSDHGPGIPAADLSRVFTKFFRRAEGRPTGSGLGLWISRGLVEAHGGRLVAESQPGQGSAFSFSLPRADRQPVFSA